MLKFELTVVSSPNLNNGFHSGGVSNPGFNLDKIEIASLESAELIFAIFAKIYIPNFDLVEPAAAFELEFAENTLIELAEAANLSKITFFP